MDNKKASGWGYVLAAVLGALGGGLIVAVATKAVPRMMAGMMQNVMAQMRREGCNPEEMCGKMMQSFAEAQPKAVPNP